MKRSINLKLKPKWDEIEKIRKKSSAFLESHGFPYDTVHALTMVISELTENAIKYGNFKQAKDKVLVSTHVGENIITIEVVNPTNGEEQKNLRKLDRSIQWIRGFQDSFEAYIEKLKEVSKKPLSDGESGLGLVRIAYEGKAIIDFFIGEGGRLNVSAVSHLNGNSGR